MTLDTITERHGRDWYRIARVRTSSAGPRASLGEGLLFAPELAPHVRHALVSSLGVDAEHELLRRALVRYLHGTSVLEVAVVNEVAARIAHGPSPLSITQEQRLEALELICDEGYHAVLASDLLHQLGHDEASAPTPAFKTRLDRLAEQESSSAGAGIVRFLFAVVSETAISTSLMNLAKNHAVLPGLRELVLDHARDEARHGAYFARLFAQFWTAASVTSRARYAALLPRLVRAFLAPDLEAVADDLAHVGLSPLEIETVIATGYAEEAVRISVLAGARPVLSCFSRAGALDAARDAFTQEGLGLQLDLSHAGRS